MEVKELRIGNLIKHEGVEIEINGIQMFSVYWGEKNVAPIRFGFEPIPLTEEWLLNFGFEHSKPNYWFKNDNKLRFSLIDNNLHCSMGDDDWGILYNRLNYVHQLQNLYFALTTQELTWK